jgi:hypothetical protein
MKHLYDNGEGELVVADSLQEAHHHHDVEMGGTNNPIELVEMFSQWSQVDDDAEVPILDLEVDTTTITTKTAREWAEMYDEPTQVATTYW